MTLDGAMGTIVALPFKPYGFGSRSADTLLLGDMLNLRVMDCNAACWCAVGHTCDQGPL